MYIDQNHDFMFSGTKVMRHNAKKLEIGIHLGFGSHFIRQYPSNNNFVTVSLSGARTNLNVGGTHPARRAGKKILSRLSIFSALRVQSVVLMSSFVMVEIDGKSSHDVGF